MIKIIKPKDQQFHKAKIGSFLDVLKVYQNLELSAEEQARTIFMIAEDEKRGVFGGATLSLHKLERLPDKIAKIISSLCLSKKRVWVANLCLCTEQDEPYSSLEQLDVYQGFYDDLFKKFIKLGKQEKVGFLVLSLRPMDFFKSKTYGHWPYLLEISPKDSLDNLFHGILALKPQKASTNKRTWSAVDCLNQLRRRGR